MIPAGIIDKNIEVFFRDKLYIIHGGKINDLVTIPRELEEFLLCFIDDAVKAGLKKMNIPKAKYLEKFLKCRYGHFDLIPDFTEDGESNSEYQDCPDRDHCSGAGIVCLKKDELTARETEVAKLTAIDLPDKQIADKMHIAYTTVRRHQKNIQEKIHSGSKVGTAVYAIVHNL